MSRSLLGLAAAPTTTPYYGPWGLQATATGQDSVDLVWNPSSPYSGLSDCDIYVERAPDSGGSPGAWAVDVVTNGYTGASRTGLSAGTTYWYRVRAWFGKLGVYSDYSQAVSVTTDAAAAPPSAVSDLAAVAVGSSTAHLTWSDVANATGYRVYRDTTSGPTPGAGTLVDTVAQGVGVYDDAGVSPSTTYYYQIIAYNGAGDAAASNEASVAMPAASSSAQRAVALSPRRLRRRRR